MRMFFVLSCITTMKRPLCHSLQRMGILVSIFDYSNWTAKTQLRLSIFDLIPLGSAIGE